MPVILNTFGMDETFSISLKKIVDLIRDSEPFLFKGRIWIQIRAKTDPKHGFKIHSPFSRHVLISEVNAAISQLPPSVARAPVISYDPLPPANSVNTYAAPPRQPTALGRM